MLKTKNKMEDLPVEIVDKESSLREELTRAIGPNFYNYPLCVNFHLQVLKYLKDYKENHS